MHMPDSDCYLISNDAGIYETLIDLDESVKKGDAVGQVHFLEKLERKPVVYFAGRDGTLIGRTHKTLVGIGDFLGMIATEMWASNVVFCVLSKLLNNLNKIMQTCFRQQSGINVELSKPSMDQRWLEVPRTNIFESWRNFVAAKLNKLKVVK